MNSILENNKTIIGVLFGSIFLKLLLLFIVGIQQFPDSNTYLKIAHKIYEAHFLFPSDELLDAPITPYFYAFLVFLENYFSNYVFVFGNIIIATATIYILFFIAKSIFNSIKIANIVAIIMAIYPFLNFYSLSILSETLYLFFIYTSFLFLVRFIKNHNFFDIILFSLIFALSVLTRFSSLPMYLIILFWSIFVVRSYVSNIKLLMYTLASIFVFTLTMLPWWIRNYNISNEIHLTTLGSSGPIFYLGNNPNNKSGGGIGGVDADFSKFSHIENEDERYEAMENAAVSWILNNPYDWFLLEVEKFKRFFSPVFYAEEYQVWYYNLLSILSYGIMLVLFVPSLFIFKEYFLLYSPFLLYGLLLVGLHMLLIASIRYRLPIEPFMIMMSSALIEKYLKNRVDYD